MYQVHFNIYLYLILNGEKLKYRNRTPVSELSYLVMIFYFILVFPLFPLFPLLHRPYLSKYCGVLGPGALRSLCGWI